MTSVRAIAAAQTVPVRGDVGRNVVEHLHLARIAADEGACVLVFPELSLTGYEIDLARELAFSERDPRLAPLVEAAAELAVTLVVVAPVRIGERLHLGAFILSPDRTVDLYTKRHLGAFPPAAARDGVVPPAEATVFHPGDRDPLVHVDGHFAAVAICADTARPEHPRAARERGARTYLASMFVIPSEYDRDAASLAAHAARHAMTVAMANYGGPTGGLAAAGGSAIWCAEGALIARLGPAGSGVVLGSGVAIRARD